MIIATMTRVVMTGRSMKILDRFMAFSASLVLARASSTPAAAASATAALAGAAACTRRAGIAAAGNLYLAAGHNPKLAVDHNLVAVMKVAFQRVVDAVVEQELDGNGLSDL